MTGPEQPIGLDQIAADDLLLDALGRGDSPSGDSVVSMLAAWRADLSEGVPEAARPAPEKRRQKRLTRMVLGAAAAAAILVAGLGVSAHQAEPGSPLWPVSKVVYPERSEVVAAEKAIADARAAVAAGRDADARRLLGVASTHVARVDDRTVVDRLRKEIQALLSSLASPPPASPQASSPRPSTAPTTPAPGQPPSAPAPTPSPSPSPSQGGLLPDLPLLPLPSIIPG
ncbi:hypothetical protein [Phytohabitans rumicis]|uniref:hypothetical protein n=1 Tax=Phytohabitans rumicis TaxID=1076125 RepID=UPI0031EFE5AA